jgi:hypothetical protein
MIDSLQQQIDEVFLGVVAYAMVHAYRKALENAHRAMRYVVIVQLSSISS